MSTVGRLKRIVKAAIVDLVQKAEDPELALSRFIEDIELAQGEVRGEIKGAQFQRDRLLAQSADLRQNLKACMARAEQAAARDEDDLAKEALRRYHGILDEAENCEERLAEAERLLATLHKDAAELERKLKEARLEQKRLSALLRRAEAEKRTAAALIRSDRDGHVIEKVQDQVLDTQTSSEADREVRGWSLEARFSSIETQPSLDGELAALKKKVKKHSSERSA